MNLNIVTDTKGYKVLDVAVVDSLSLLNGPRDKLVAMYKTEIVGKGKEHYASFLNNVIDKAKEELHKKAEKLGGDALYDVKVSPFIQDVKGDTLVGAVAQCVVLKKGD
jgi:uncharacterized protein YbjQ (UPF0145 family)